MTEKNKVGQNRHEYPLMGNIEEERGDLKVYIKKITDKKVTLKCCFIILLTLCSLSSCLDPITHRNNPELIEWKGMKEDSAQSVIAQKVPLKATPAIVTQFCKKQGLSPSPLTPHPPGFFITASSPIISEKVMTKAKWLFKFYFDRSKRLTKTTLHKSLIPF
ncbi:hypothetical protein [Microscilla marina]|uniref:Uncharacterized protein n=1 Tax=Microscilla marina ATCC 23134 TaxID=313606 RepID=A1ZXJ9_MICM2|nr:hypothetical protein [Microscilla marina]EAY24874.1 hypothetical protein M23134_05849 [Microscilla marina ATCC 23134]